MYTHISTDIRFDESIEMNKDKKKDIVDDFSSNIKQENDIKINTEENETHNLNIISNNIIDDEESVKLIKDIMENNDDSSVVRNNTPISTDSNGIELFNGETHITDENVFDNFKNISQSFDNLLSKDNIDLTSNYNKSADKGVSDVSDISDDVSVMSEIIIDEPDNTIATAEPMKPKRGRKKKN
jgi:hypothetical protein